MQPKVDLFYKHSSVALNAFTLLQNHHCQFLDVHKLSPNSASTEQFSILPCPILGNHHFPFGVWESEYFKHHVYMASYNFLYVRLPSISLCPQDSYILKHVSEFSIFLQLILLTIQ